MIYPCSFSQETLRLDVYSPQSRDSGFQFTGTVANRLNVITDPKQIKEFSRSAALSSSLLPTKPLSRRGNNSERTPEAFADPEKLKSPAAYPKPDSSLESGLYAVNASDSSADVASKFLHLLALGPISRADIVARLNLHRMVPDSELNSLISTHTQLFSAANTFTEADVYPSIALQNLPQKHNQALLILKDKAYKELRPWLWTAYTPFERGLIIDNVQNALTRLGFLDTHPLRRKIVEKSVHNIPLKRATALGGGILLSSGKKGSTPSSPQPTSLPARRAGTESPGVESERKRPESRLGVSPLKETQVKRKYETILTVCLSSSDEDKHSKKAKKEGHRSNSSTSTNSVSSVNSMHSHQSSGSYTLPYSVTEDGHEEEAFGGSIKYPAVAKQSLQLPARPSSAISTQEKKLQFYEQLAKKFRLRYREYEILHKQMGRGSSQSKSSDSKKSLMRLFELHNSLAEWKRKLWDYHNENNMAETVMNLSKHRKLMSTSAISSLAPSSARLHSVDKFTRDSSVERNAPNPRGSTPVTAARTKITLNYWSRLCFCIKATNNPWSFISFSSLPSYR